MNTIRYVLPDGTQQWFMKGKGLLHRDDGPAMIHPDGSRFWFRNGVLDRIGRPAVILADGRKGWWVAGRFLFGQDASGNRLEEPVL